MRELWQLYMRELAEFRESITSLNGRFRDDRLLTYLAYEDHWPFFIRVDTEIAGFALIRKSKPNTHVIGEFFVKQQFRRIGMGAAAVSEIVRKFSGQWEIPFQEENVRGAIFWRKTIPQLGYQVNEARVPVSDMPDLPHEVQLSFTVTDVK